VAPGYVEDRPHITRLPTVMYRDNRLGAGRDSPLDFRRVKVKRIGATIHKDRACLEIQDYFCGGRKGDRRHDHLIASTDAYRLQREMQGGGAGVNCTRLLQPTIRGKY